MVRAELGLSEVAAAAFPAERQATVRPSLGQGCAASHHAILCSSQCLLGCSWSTAIL